MRPPRRLQPLSGGASASPVQVPPSIKRWDDMPRSLIPRACAIFVTCGAILISRPLYAQTLSPYSEFQSLTSDELATLQVKVTDVGARTRHVYTLVVSRGGHPVDLTVFRPFYRQEFLEFY